jgi:hypothetical protein
MFRSQSVSWVDAHASQLCGKESTIQFLSFEVTETETTTMDKYYQRRTTNRRIVRTIGSHWNGVTVTSGYSSVSNGEIVC